MIYVHQQLEIKNIPEKETKMPENAAALVHNLPKASVCVPHCATNNLSTEIALSSQFTSRHHCIVCVFLLLYNALD